MEFFHKKAEALSIKTDEMRKESSSKVNKKLVIHQIWETFCLSTNAHGFFKVAEDVKIMRIVWICIMCITLIGLFSLIFLLLQHLLLYHLKAEVEISPHKYFIMPDVTICPRQRYFFYDMSPLPKGVSSFTPSTTFVTGNFTFQQYFQTSSLIWNVSGFESDSNRLARYSMLQLSQDYNLLRGQFDILIILNYLRKNISADEFLLLLRPDGFRCITYRPINRKVTLSDESSNLFSIVFVPPIGSDDVYEAMVQTNSELELLRIGTSLYIHPPETLPEFETQELIIPRDYLVQLAIERNENYLSDIKNRCQKEVKPIQIRQNNVSLEFKYSRSMCLNLRQQLYIYQNCKCISETLFWPVDIPLNASLCHQIPFTLISRLIKANGSLQNSTLNYTDWLSQEPLANFIKSNHQCHDTFIANFNPDDENSNCPVPCDTVMFSYDKSIIYFKDTINQFGSVVWGILPNLTQKMKSLNLPIGQYDMSVNQYLINRLCAISIFPKSFNIKVIREETVYQLGNFFSEVGGAMGLFVGFTMITFFDLFELLLFILGFLFSEFKKKKKIDSPDMD